MSKNSGGYCTANPINIATGEKYLTMLDYRAAGAGQLSFERYYSSYSEAETSLGRGWRSNFDRKLIFSDITIDDEASSITYEDAKGEHIQFSRSFAGGWNNTSNTLHTLTPHSQGWQLNDGKGNHERFNRDGLLISSYQLGGYEQRLQYNEQQQLIRVIDSFQRQLSFAYNADGLLSQMTDPQGQVTQYHYNDNLVLNKVSKPSHDEGNGQDGFKQYHYDDQRFPYAITGISDELGQRLHTMAYDDHGRAIVSALGGSAERVDIRFHGYNEQGQRRATVKNALGRETTYTFDQDNKPVSISGHATNNCIAANQAYSYDERGNILSKTDWNGNITRFEYNQRNLETLRIEAAGTELERQIRTQWHTDFARPVRIIEPGRTTDMHYNQHGLLLEQTVYDTQSKRSRLQQWLGSYPSRSIHYRYSAQGQLIEVDGPRNDVADITRFAYDAAGNRISITNALGQKIQVLAFDANGRPLRLRDAQGLETELAYNTRGWLSHKTVKTQQGDVTTRYDYAHSGDYNGQGQISRISLPNGNQIHYEYDSANRLIALSNRLGERLEYTLDLEGNRIGERTLNPQGELIKARQQLFDELSRLLAVVGSQGQQSRYQYDGQGNLIAHSDGRNHQTRYAFDALNRLISTYDAHQGQIQQSYNAQGLLSQVTDQRGLSTQYQYNGFGDRIARISPDTGRTDYHYNTAGLLISKTDARGIQTQYHYDVLGRVIHQHYPAANDEDIYYDYDQLSLNGHQISQPGRLLQVRDGSGSRLYQYNELGQITEQQSRIIASRATGSSQQSDTQQNAKQQNYHYQAQYNLAGELESERYPGGAQIHYQRDAIGRIQQLSVQASANSAEQSVAKDIDYASFSGLQSLRYGNGLQLERKRDLDGRISRIQLSSDTAQLTNDTAQLTNDTATNDALYHGQYDYDLNGNVIAIHEQGDTQHYRYDALNRLISSDNKHHRLSYEYDSVGNRRQRQQNKNYQEAEKGAQEHYHYAEHSNRLLSVRNLFNNTERKLDYDALGNIIRDQRSSKTLSLSYNAANRLEQIDIALNEQERSLGISHKTAYYRYNASGQRVSKWVWQQHESGRQGLDPSASRHFHYNPHQQLIAETDHQGNAIKAYIYAGETRVALLDYRHKPEGELYFIHNDHLGTPKLITNSAQEIVWRNTASAFGQVQTAQINDNDHSAQTLEQNLSFPGQYRDTETGFSYNYFRDYDPSLGRYIQSDPIGLEGGVNTYGYVMGNPVGLVDPLGLREFTESDTNRFLSMVRQANSLTQAFSNHRSGGKLDIMYGRYQNDLFNVNGRIYDAGEFGNFMAAYAGQYHWGAAGYYAVRAAGIYYDYALYPNPGDAKPWETKVWDWDADSLPALEAGRKQAKLDRENNLKDHSCPVLP